MCKDKSLNWKVSDKPTLGTLVSSGRERWCNQWSRKGTLNSSLMKKQTVWNDKYYENFQVAMGREEGKGHLVLPECSCGSVRSQSIKQMKLFQQTHTVLCSSFR